MDPITIAAGISAIGNLAGGFISSGGQQSANAQSAAYNAIEAQKNRDWQERMANTAYQRAMADMKQAGLNPILAYQQGGAGIGSGAQASVKFENTMEGIGHGVSSAGQAATRAIELQNVASQTNNNAAQTEVRKNEVELTKANTQRTIQDTITSAAQARRTDAETAYTMEQMKNPEELRKLWAAQAHSARASGDLSDEQRKNPNQHVRQFKSVFGDIFGTAAPPPRSPTSAKDAATNSKPADPSGILPNWLFGR